jgi:hypothetical protein
MDRDREWRLKSWPTLSNERILVMNSMLVVFYWILLLLVVIGVFAPATWEFAPRANAFVTLLLFIIIGIKLLKPAW